MVTIVMTTQMECDTLLVCIGRKPYTDGLGLEVCPGYYFSVNYNLFVLFRNWALLWIRGDVFQLMHASKHLLTSKYWVVTFCVNILAYMPLC